MQGGKRFAEDFDRIDAVKPNDRILIQDSGDGIVKFANPSQLGGSTGGGGFDMPVTMEYATRDDGGKNTPAFRIKGLTGSIDRYRVFFYRHILSRRSKRSETGDDPDRYTRYGWIHPTDGTQIASDQSGRGNVMINDNLVNERVIMTEFGLRQTDTPGVYTLAHWGRDGESNKRDPDAPVSAMDIISPYVWVWRNRDRDYLARVSFGRTYRGGTIINPEGSSQTRLRNMGFALVRITDRGPEVVTGILPFAVRFSVGKDRIGFVYVAYK